MYFLGYLLETAPIHCINMNKQTGVALRTKRIVLSTLRGVKIICIVTNNFQYGRNKTFCIYICHTYFAKHEEKIVFVLQISAQKKYSQNALHV
jgi:hypothetical protein